MTDEEKIKEELGIIAKKSVESATEVLRQIQGKTTVEQITLISIALQERYFEGVKNTREFFEPEIKEMAEIFENLFGDK